MRLPPSLSPKRTRKQREQALAKIAREADRTRRGLHKTPGARLGRQPGAVVFAMIALAAVGGLLISTSKKTAVKRPPGFRAAKAEKELDVLATALALYRTHVGHYPTETEGGLVALVAHPGASNWRGPYITMLCPDPWGRPYIFALTNNTPALQSFGPDRLPNTADDLYAAPESFTVAPNLAAAWEGKGETYPTVAIPAENYYNNEFISTPEDDSP